MRMIWEDTLPPGIPQTASLRELLTDYLDIRAVPRRSFFEFLRYFASDDREREKLEEFCKPDGQASQ
jgi:sulfite reductase alpha subunit-like flavoprotein